MDFGGYTKGEKMSDAHKERLRIGREQKAKFKEYIKDKIPYELAEKELKRLINKYKKENGESPIGKDFKKIEKQVEKNLVKKMYKVAKKNVEMPVTYIPTIEMPVTYTPTIEETNDAFNPMYYEDPFEHAYKKTLEHPENYEYKIDFPNDANYYDDTDILAKRHRETLKNPGNYGLKIREEQNEMKAKGELLNLLHMRLPCLSESLLDYLYTFNIEELKEFMRHV